MTKAQQNPSLQWKLIRWLMIATTLIATLAGSVSFWQSYQIGLDYQDDLLRQTAALINPQIQKNVDIQSDVEIYVRELGNYLKDGQLPLSMRDGFHHLQFQQENYRVYVYTYPTGERVAFSQKTEFRDDLAFTGAWATALPLLLLIPILILICIFIIRQLFKPVQQLAQDIQHRQQDLQPLSTQHIPREITYFIHQINLLLERVQLSIQQQQRFIADAAHELRSPLTALSLQAERLAQTDLNDDSRERLDVLQQSIQRHRHLLEQLLSLAKNQAQHIENKQQISVMEIYQQVIQLLYPLAEQKHIDLGIRESQDVQILAEPTALFTLLKNLVDNAIRYIPEHGQIDLAIEQQQDCIILIVEDNGQGIAPEQRERVFDAFYRILGTQVVGSGLGLSIVKSIADKMGWQLVLKDSMIFASGLRVEIQIKC